MTTWTSTGIPLAQVAAEAGHLDQATFAERWGNGFFVLLGVWSPRGPREARQTMRHMSAIDDDTRVRPERAAKQMMVFPVKKAPRSELAFVCIGRLDANDVALADDTVSKFHAYVKADADGSYTLLQDGRSRNGTFVDGEPVAARGSGNPTKLRPGATVRFGSVSMAYVNAEGLLALVRSAAFLEPAARASL